MEFFIVAEIHAGFISCVTLDDQVGHEEPHERDVFSILLKTQYVEETQNECLTISTSFT